MRRAARRLTDDELDAPTQESGARTVYQYDAWHHQTDSRSLHPRRSSHGSVLDRPWHRCCQSGTSANVSITSANIVGIRNTR